MESVDYNWQCGDWISYRPGKARCIMQHACARSSDAGGAQAVQAMQVIKHDNDEDAVQGSLILKWLHFVSHYRLVHFLPRSCFNSSFFSSLFFFTNIYRVLARTLCAMCAWAWRATNYIVKMFHTNDERLKLARRKEKRKKSLKVWKHVWTIWRKWYRAKLEMRIFLLLFLLLEVTCDPVLCFTPCMWSFI